MAQSQLQSAPWAEKEREKMEKIEERGRKREKNKNKCKRRIFPSPFDYPNCLIYLDLLETHTKGIYPNYTYSFYKEIKVFES